MGRSLLPKTGSNFINEHRMADARLDRLTSKANRVERKGESMKKKNENRLSNDHLKTKSCFTSNIPAKGGGLHQKIESSTIKKIVAGKDTRHSLKKYTHN